MDEDQLYLRPCNPPLATEMIPVKFVAEPFARLRKDIALAAPIGIIGGAYLLIAWIELSRRACL
jgi:hypothetical protein